MLLTLPNEVLLLIVDQIPSEPDISALTLTAPRLHTLLTDHLHKQNIRNSHSSALFWGTRNNRINTVTRLLDLDADPNAMDPEEQCTALQIAAENGFVDIVRLLLDRGATYSRLVGASLWTPLCVAAAGGQAAVVRILLDREDAALVPGREEGTAYWSGIYWYMSAHLNQELRHGEGPRGQDPAVLYSIPLFLAISSGHDVVAEMLMGDKRVDLEYRDLSGRTALIWAVSHNRRRVVTGLLNHGVDPNACDNNGQTALMTAVDVGNSTLVDLILDHERVDPNKGDDQH
ncbi:ankyrin repeat-containing domain protein [Aspergillus cavernicola]|uniref:Ankyrin repeat-containing domain protein n=1 Tax=Aspergillus cavernicola TaxID=176166 RepID=A0ABR4HL06_9EURO